MPDTENHGPLKTLQTGAYPVVFMFAATFLTTGILVGIARLTASRVEANRQVLVEKSVMMALGLDMDDRMPPSRIHQMFLDRVAPPVEASAGAYRLMEADRVTAYAVPFEGRGFWDTIKGFVGVRADGQTMLGIAFYQQSETPGLGGEIVKPHFLNQFKGLELLTGVPALRFRPVGAATAAGEVHAITGATQTCTRLEWIMSDALDRWRERMGLKPATDREHAADAEGRGVEP
mgnify:CR=1 FL=1